MDITNVSSDECRKLLAGFIDKFNELPFGVLPKREIDILVFQLMQDLHILSENPTIFELVEKLRVTRSRARSLIYEANLRKFNRLRLDENIKEMLKHPVFKRGDEKHVCFEVENPLIADYLRDKFSELGHAMDGSFSPTLIVLSHEMVAVLLEENLSDSDRNKVLEKLAKAGQPNITVKNVLTGMLNQLGKKVAGDVGEELTGNLVAWCSSSITDEVVKVLAALNTHPSGKASK